MRTLYLILFITATFSPLKSQGTVEWLVQSTGPGVDDCEAMFHSRNGYTAVSGLQAFGDIVIGDTILSHRPDSNTNGYVYLVDSIGSIVWVKTITGVRFYDLSISKKGEVIATGGVDSRRFLIGQDTFTNNVSIADSREGIIVKFDPTGSLSFISMTQTRRGCSAYVKHYFDDMSGDLLVPYDFNSDTLSIQGETISFSMDFYSNHAVARYDSAFNLIDLYPVEGNEVNSIRSIYSDSGENIVITGTTQGDSMRVGDTSFYLSNFDDFFTYVIKISPEGQVLWSKSIGSSDGFLEVLDLDIFGTDVFLIGWLSGSDLLFEGDKLVSGLMSQGSGYTFSGWQMKLKGDGNVEWTNAYELNESYLNSLSINDKGNIASHWSFKADSIDFLDQIFHRTGSLSYAPDALLTVQNGEGELIWAHSYGGESPDFADAISITTEGDLIVYGMIESDSVKLLDRYIINDNPPDRNQIRPSKTFVAKIVPDYTTSIFDYFPDLETLKIYPSPSNGSFTIVGKKSEDQVKIYDLSGRRVTFSKYGDQISLDNPVAGTYVVILSRQDDQPRYGKLVVAGK